MELEQGPALALEPVLVLVLEPVLALEPVLVLEQHRRRSNS